MEPLFIAHRTLTRRMVMEAYLRYQSTQKRVYNTSARIAGIVLAYNAVRLYLNDKIPMGIIQSILAVICMFLFFNGHILEFNKYYKMVVNSSEHKSSQYVFLDNGFCKNAKYPYSEIKQVWETRNLCILVLSTGMLFFGKNRFAKGDYNAFIDFVSRKCPTAIMDRK